MRAARILNAIVLWGALSCFAAEPQGTPGALREPAREVWRGWLWIPLNEAFTSTGIPIAGRIPEHAARSLSMNVYEGNSASRRTALDAVNNEGDCPLVTSAHEDRIVFKPNETLPDLARNADGIFQGVILAKRPGLLLGQAGTLLEVTVEKTMKGPKRERIFIFYPQLRVIIGSTVVCRQEASFRLVPHIGDRVILFALADALNAAGNLFKPEQTELIFAEATGELRAPAVPNQYPPSLTTLDQLDSSIERIQRGADRAPARQEREQ